MIIEAKGPPETIYGYKFGGTAQEDSRCYENHVRLLREGPQRALRFVVHSAISTGNKEEGTTTLIKKATDAAKCGDRHFASNHVSRIEAIHNEMIERIITSSKERPETQRIITERLNELRSFLDELQALVCAPNIEPKLYDRAIGFGEALSTPIAVANYRQHGILAEEVDLRDAVSEFDPESETLIADMANIFGRRVNEVLMRGSLPVVTGHGTNLYRLFDRGYSDAMAILLTNYLTELRGKKGLLTIAKNGVPGVLSADPDIVKEGVHLVPKLSFSELGRLQAEVVHPLLLPHVRKGVSLQVRNILDLEARGTSVTHEEVKVQGRRCKAINVLGVKGQSILLIQVKTAHMVGRAGYVAKIAAALRDRTIDMVNTTPDSMRLTVRAYEEDIPAIKEALAGIGEVTVLSRIAQVIMAGRELEDVALSEIIRAVEDVLNASRESGRIFAPQALEYDTREPNYIGVAVPQYQAEEVARALHRTFVEESQQAA